MLKFNHCYKLTSYSIIITSIWKKKKNTQNTPVPSGQRQPSSRLQQWLHSFISRRRRRSCKVSSSPMPTAAPPPRKTCPTDAAKPRPSPHALLITGVQRHTATTRLEPLRRDLTSAMFLQRSSSPSNSIQLHLPPQRQVDQAKLCSIASMWKTNLSPTMMKRYELKILGYCGVWRTRRYHLRRLERRCLSNADYMTTTPKSWSCNISSGASIARLGAVSTRMCDCTPWLSTTSTTTTQEESWSCNASLCSSLARRGAVSLGLCDSRGHAVPYRAWSPPHTSPQPGPSRVVIVFWYAVNAHGPWAMHKRTAGITRCVLV